MVPMNQTRLYQEDWIGLRAMDEAGKLSFISTPGNHLQFTEKFFIEKIIRPFLT